MPANEQQDVVRAAHDSFESSGEESPSSSTSVAVAPAAVAPVWETEPHPNLYTRIQQRRARILSAQRFLNQEVSLPMSSSQKAFMAATDVADPVNLGVIAASSAIYTAANPNSAYGPGMKGFGLNYGYSLSQDATSEGLGTWLIPSLTHQDPRYHRIPGAPVQRRIFHALAHTLVAQRDDGSSMPNYATLLTYPGSAALANLYVPGLHRDVPSTTKRVVIGLATDPADTLIAEFLPDVARRIHIRVTFFQRVINDLSTEHPVQ